MTNPDDAVTVADLREHLDDFDDDAPVAVAASGAYDFLHEDGLDESTLKPDVGGGRVVYLDGDEQGGRKPWVDDDR